MTYASAFEEAPSQVTPTPDDDPRIVHLSRDLDLSGLKRLLDPNDSVLAIRVSDYISEDLCDTFKQKLAAAGEGRFRRYAHAPALPVTKMGATFGEACVLPEDLLDAYFDEAPATQQFYREVFLPYLSPIDKVRLDLDKLWPEGSIVPQMYGRRMLSGFVRRTELHGSIVPHQDDLLEEAPQSPDFKPTVELVHNVYLDVPNAGCGGELEVYDFGPNYREHMKETQHVGHAKVDHLLLDSVFQQLASQPSVVLRPARGDLILFKGGNIHRVHTVKAGNRVTSCFHIGYVNNEEPLRCWI